MSDAQQDIPAVTFVVGLPRTGTKLVKIILRSATSTNCRISEETWFFGDLFRSGIRKKIKKIGDMKVDDNVHALVDYFFSGKFSRSYWEIVVRPGSGFNRAEMEDNILRSDRSEKAIYTEIMNAFARRNSQWRQAERKMIGDKTPGHLYHVPTLLEWFPDAKIVHTFRDPRAIVVSEWKKIVDSRRRKGAGMIISLCRSMAVYLYITFTWLYARRLHQRYSRLYPDNYLLSRYEDIIEDPEAGVGKIAEFLNIEVNDQMLKPRQAGSSYGERKGKQGIDSSGSQRWRDHLSPWGQRWFSFWVGRYLDEFGYHA